MGRAQQAQDCLPASPCASSATAAHHRRQAVLQEAPPRFRDSPNPQQRPRWSSRELGLRNRRSVAAWDRLAEARMGTGRLFVEPKPEMEARAAGRERRWRRRRRCTSGARSRVTGMHDRNGRVLVALVDAGLRSLRRLPVITPPCGSYPSGGAVLRVAIALAFEGGSR